MSVLILDTETTGTDPRRDRVVEVGCVLFSLEHVSIVSCFSTVIQVPDGQPADSERVNGIPSKLISEAAAPAEDAWKQIRSYVSVSKAIVAHNAEFDRGFVPDDVRDAKPWICSQDDLAWPKASASKGLVAVALAHGVGVSHAHRALTDCMLIARLLERLHETGHDVRAFLRRGLRPKARFRVAATGFDEQRNALVKAHGFRWEKPHWVRSMAIEDAAALPFDVVKLEPARAPGAVGGPLFDDPLASWNKGAA